MTRTLASIYSVAWRAIILFLSVEIAIVSLLRYFTSFGEPPEPILANAFAQPFLPIHVASSVVALLAGPLQFVRQIRTRWPPFHRFTGRTYVAAVAIGAPSGFVLAIGAIAGVAANTGFAVVAVLCTAFTWLGWRAAVERRFDAHCDWMLRSYAMIAAAITLRLLIPLCNFLELDFFAAYRVNSWLAWLINLALVEYAIRRRRGRVEQRLSPPLMSSIRNF
jgi:uncharacterized membrane protein